MSDRLKSRKLWVTILALALVTIGGAVGVDLDAEQLDAVIWIVAAYLGGQGITDAGKATLTRFAKDVGPQVVEAVEAKPEADDGEA